MKNDISAKLRLLMLDPDSLQGSIYPVLFRRYGIEVTVAREIESARILVDTGNFDAVLSEVVIHNEVSRDFVDFLKRVKMGGIPVIVNSTFSFCKGGERLKELSAIGACFFMKCESPVELIAKTISDQCQKKHVDTHAVPATYRQSKTSTLPCKRAVPNRG